MSLHTYARTHYALVAIAVSSRAALVAAAAAAARLLVPVVARALAHTGRRHWFEVYVCEECLCLESLCVCACARAYW